MARRTTNPFDPNADPYRIAGGGATPSYIPASITSGGLADTGIPQVGISDPNPSYIPNVGTGTKLPPDYSSTPGGYSLTGEYRPPTGGINPDGMYSGTGVPTPTGAPVDGQSIIQQLQAKYPATPQGYQALINDPLFKQSGYSTNNRGNADIVVDPQGNMVDIRTSGNTWWWHPVDEAQDAREAAEAYGGGTAQAGGDPQFNDALRRQLEALMGRTDPTGSRIYQNAVAAYDNQQQRNTETQRNAIAERMAASGQANSGAMDSRLLGAEQARGENTAAFSGDLAVRMLEQERDQIMQALQINAGLYTESQRLALQDKLGMINANLQQQGITNQQNQWTSEFGWGTQKYDDLTNQDWLKTLIGG